MPLVIDASYTIALALQEGDVPGADTVGDRLAGEGAIVPAMWRFEVANVLLTAVRRKRIEATLPAVILADLASLDGDLTAAARRENLEVLGIQ